MRYFIGAVSKILTKLIADAFIIICLADFKSSNRFTLMIRGRQDLHVVSFECHCFFRKNSFEVDFLPIKHLCS